jgi:hypothetical protein
MADEPSYQTQRWSKHFDEIDLEIARLAKLLKVPILDPGVIERVLHNDALVCGAPKPQMFEKMRGLLMMHYSVRTKALEALGPEQTLLVVGDVVERLRARFGDSLGEPAA